MYFNKVSICGINTSSLTTLKEKEKIELLHQVKQGNKFARDKLINGNLRLVLSVIQRFTNRGENLDDLFQVGCIGLIKAIDNFDLTKPVRFSTYAVPMNILCRKGETMRPRKWTETAIKQAFDSFIKDYGRLPTSQEMYTTYNGMFPRPLSVKLVTGMTMKKYLETYYPKYINRCPYTKFNLRTKQDWIENFKEQYISYNKPTETEYNKLREKGTPNTQTLAKIIGVKTWCEVLDYCGLNKTSRRKLSGELQFEETLENYKNLNDKIQSALNHRKRQL